MPILPRLAGLWNALVRRDRVEQELDEEIRAAADLLAERYAAAGLDAQAAWRAAMTELGGIEQVKEAVREHRAGARLDALRLDLRHAWRSLARAPGLAAVIIVTLALGIGANTAIFSVVRALLLAPLPYHDADRLFIVWSDLSAAGYPRAPLSGPELQDLRDGSRRSCTGFAAIWANNVALNGIPANGAVVNGAAPGADAPSGAAATRTAARDAAQRPEQLTIGRVTPNFFDLLGVQPALGRAFRAGEDSSRAEPTILLGWPLFQHRFHGDPAIVGRRILVNGRATTVIGVMPETFHLRLPPDASVPDDLQAWLPFASETAQMRRGRQFLRVLGRLRPGATLADAQADAHAVAQRISRTFRSEYGPTGRAFTAVALHADETREIRGPLLALFAGVGLLLAIACVNVASLLIARAAARTRETALRLALGASRGRLLRQALTEGLLLTMLGGAAGLVTGAIGLRLLLALRPESLSRIAASRIDVTVLAFTLGLSVIWGLLFSLAPMAELLRTPADRPLQPHARAAAATPIRYRTRATLVTAQIALSIILLVCAGLLVRAFVALQRVDPGFRTDRPALTFRIVIPYERYGSDDAFNVLAGRLTARVAALPGVTGLGTISHLPYDDLPNWFTPYRAVATAALETTAARETMAAPRRADLRAVSTGLFDTLGVSLVAGRFFTEQDDVTSRGTAIVDEQLARRLSPDGAALGRTILIDPDTNGTATVPVTIVGIVRHLRLRSLVDDLTEQVFLPERQAQRNPLGFVVRTVREAAAVEADVRAAVAEIDPQLPVYDVRPFADYVETARATRRFTVRLAAAFAGCALGLTCVGVYGVLAYGVARRRHEIGVRRALGASPADVLRDVLRDGLTFALAGCAIGLAGAIAASRLLQGQLYAIHPHDPLTYTAAVALLFCGAALACWIPARRAMRVNPMDALTFE